MIDADGKSIVRNKHLLSLKDLNQSEELEQLLDAGAFFPENRGTFEGCILR